MNFSSDNSFGIADEVMAAVSAANQGAAASYGGDEWTARVHRRLAEVFECNVDILLVPSGTAANALALTSLCPPWGAVVCHETAHILNSEGGATSMLGAGAQMHGVPGDDFLMSPEGVRGALDGTRWVLGAAEPGSIDAAGFDAAIGTKAIEQAQTGLISDMDRVADALYGRT